MHISTDPRTARSNQFFVRYPALIELAGHQQGALSARQVLSFLGRRQVEKALVEGCLVRLWRDAYVLGQYQDHLPTRLAAADLGLDHPAVACLETAAALHGFDVTSDGNIHVLAQGAHRSETAVLHLHRTRTVDPLVEIDRRRATSARETAVTLAARAPEEIHAIAILDAAVRSGATTVEDLSDFAGSSTIAGIRTVRALLALIDPSATSPMESWLRLSCLRGGMPVPVTQYQTRGADGRTYLLPLAWPKVKVGIEFDRPNVVVATDRIKANALAAAGWALFTLTEADLTERRVATLGMIRSEVDRRLRQTPSGWQRTMPPAGTEIPAARRVAQGR